MAPTMPTKAKRAPGPPSPFVRRLQQAMAARQLTYDRLEEGIATARGKAQATKGYLSRLITESRSPRLDLVEAIAQAAGVRLAWLVAGEGPMLPTGAQRNENLPGWAEAAAEVKARRRVPAFAVEAAGRLPAVVHPEIATAEFVRDVAHLWWCFASESEVEEAEAVAMAGVIDAEGE